MNMWVSTENIDDISKRPPLWSSAVVSSVRGLMYSLWPSHVLKIKVGYFRFSCKLISYRRKSENWLALKST